VRLPSRIHGRCSIRIALLALPRWGLLFWWYYRHVSGQRKRSCHVQLFGGVSVQPWFLWRFFLCCMPLEFVLSGRKFCRRLPDKLDFSDPERFVLRVSLCSWILRRPVPALQPWDVVRDGYRQFVPGQHDIQTRREQHGRLRLRGWIQRRRGRCLHDVLQQHILQGERLRAKHI